MWMKRQSGVKNKNQKSLRAMHMVQPQWTQNEQQEERTWKKSIPRHFKRCSSQQRPMTSKAKECVSKNCHCKMRSQRRVNYVARMARNELVHETERKKPPPKKLLLFLKPTRRARGMRGALNMRKEQVNASGTNESAIEWTNARKVENRYRENEKWIHEPPPQNIHTRCRNSYMRKKHTPNRGEKEDKEKEEEKRKGERDRKKEREN